MDYVVAHLLRVLQETIEYNAPRDRLPPCIESAKIWRESSNVLLHETEIVEEAVFHVMNKFLVTYNIRHMYWPELRCLKTCCRVFAMLIEKKLPVLADHFEHHDLNSKFLRCQMTILFNVIQKIHANHMFLNSWTVCARLVPNYVPIYSFYAVKDHKSYVGHMVS